MTVMDKRTPHPGLVVWIPHPYGDEHRYTPVLCEDTDEALETIVSAGIEKFNDIVVTREVLWKLMVS